MGLLPSQIDGLVPYELKEPVNDKKRKDFTKATGLDVGYELNAVRLQDLEQQIIDDIELFIDQDILDADKRRSLAISEKFMDIKNVIHPLFKAELERHNLI